MLSSLTWIPFHRRRASSSLLVCQGRLNTLCISIRLHTEVLRLSPAAGFLDLPWPILFYDGRLYLLLRAGRCWRHRHGVRTWRNQTYILKLFHGLAVLSSLLQLLIHRHHLLFHLRISLHVVVQFHLLSLLCVLVSCNLCPASASLCRQLHQVVTHALRH